MSTIPTARLLLFGGATLEGDRGPIGGRGAQRRRLALLSILAVSARPVSRDKLIGYLWEEADTDKARRLLSESVYVIRKSLGEDALPSAGNDLRLNHEVVWSDVVEFAKCLQAGEDERAIALYKGSLLDGFFVSDASEFEQWLDRERDRLAREYAGAITRLAQRADQEGDYRAAANWWRKLSDHDPYSGTPVLELMRALDAINDRPAALQAARAHGDRLRADLGNPPDQQVEAFAQELKNAPPGESPARVRRDQISCVAVARAPQSQPEPEPGPAQQPVPPILGVQRTRTRRRLAWLTALTGIGVMTAILIVIMNEPEPVSGMGGVTTLAIFPFSGPVSVADWRNGVDQIVSNNLDGAGDLKTVDPHALIRARRRGNAQLNPADAARVARRNVAQLFVLGEIIEAGGLYKLTATLYATNRPELKIAVVEAGPGTSGDVFAMIDVLSKDLLARAGKPGTSLRRSAAELTKSFEAFKHYVIGDEYFLNGQYDSAVVALEKAVEVDPNYALAYYRLSAASEWSFEFQKARFYARKAEELSGRLPTQEQALIAPWIAFLEGRYESAARNYNIILGSDQHNVEARAGLGEVLIHYNPLRGLPTDSAGPLFTRVLEQVPEYGEARFHVLELAARARDLPRFDSVARDLDARNPQRLAWEAVRAALAGPQKQQGILNQLGRADDMAVGLAAARVAAHTHNFAFAHQIAQHLTSANRPEGWRAAAHLLLAEMAMAGDDWAGAKRLLASADTFDRDWTRQLTAFFLLHPFVAASRDQLLLERDALLRWDATSTTPSLSPFLAAHASVRSELKDYLLGLISIELDDFDEAGRYQNLLAKRYREEAEAKFAHALAESLRGHSAAAQGKNEEAIRILEGIVMQSRPEFLAVSPFYARVYDRYAMAKLNELQGNKAKAIRWYESLLEGLDFLYAAPAHRELAALYADKDTVRANAHLTEFARLTKGARR